MNLQARGLLGAAGIVLAVIGAGLEWGVPSAVLVAGVGCMVVAWRAQ